MLELKMYNKPIDNNVPITSYFHETVANILFCIKQNPETYHIVIFKK